MNFKKVPAIKAGDWQLREGRLTYEAAVYAHDQGILALGFDRSGSMNFIIQNENFFQDNPDRQRQLASTGTLVFGFIVIGLLGSFIWRWWFFLPCLVLAFVAVVVKMTTGAKNCSRIIITEALKNKELYDMIQEQGGWYFTAPHSLEEIEEMYEERDPAQDAAQSDEAPQFFTTKI